MCWWEGKTLTEILSQLMGTKSFVARSVLVDPKVRQVAAGLLPPKRTVDECDLIGLSATGDLPALFAATMAWGWGRQRFGPKNIAAALAEPQLQKRLEDSADLVSAGKLGEAYDLLSNEDTRLPGVGEAFFTKWLWAVGLALNPCPEPVPLILDSKVWNSIRALPWRPPGGRRSTSRPWSARAERYLAYCRLAAAHPPATSAGTVQFDRTAFEDALFDWNGGW